MDQHLVLWLTAGLAYFAFLPKGWRLKIILSLSPLTPKSPSGSYFLISLLARLLLTLSGPECHSWSWPVPPPNSCRATRVRMPSCPKDVLRGRGRSQDVWPWQQVTTKIKYHPFPLVAGGGVCMVLSSSQQDTTWSGKSSLLPWRRSPWALGRISEVQTPVACLSQSWSQDLSLQRKVSKLCHSLGQL